MKYQLLQKIVSLLIFVGITAFSHAQESVYQDEKGIIRWIDTKDEVALFGANYCLPSACDYRAAGLFTDDLKEVVDQDMTHFARMGWDALRLCLWGDWENSDKQGNLVANEHLDLLDYVILKARKRGIYMLLSPVVTYSSLFPDKMSDTTSVDGFSTHFKKSELGTNPEAIAAQCNYWKQLLDHVNPYTGVALKDEPNILFLETINEPTHHSDDLNGSVSYINTLVDAIKSTGCKKLIFHNYTQDNKIGKAIKESNVDGASFAWYPTGLNSGHTLQGNHLRSTDDFPPMLSDDIKDLSRIVYEFDSPDLNTGYMFPAMARTFRTVGTQFATMFSYDMLVSAPYNQGWQTHLLNMVYTPVKAVSAMISAHVMKELPLYKSYGVYPQNTTFENFKVSYEENSSIMNTKEVYMNANSTSEVPLDANLLKQVVGTGTSPLVSYKGLGVYFLDKVEDGLWRLEVYPDALTVNDPFNWKRNPRVDIRLISQELSMSLSLPNLGQSFTVEPVNEGNNFRTSSTDGSFNIRPGVYVLASKKYETNQLPEKIGQLGFHEFICPPDEKLPPQISVSSAPAYCADSPVEIEAQLVANETINKLELIANVGPSKESKRFPMVGIDRYRYVCHIPAGTLPEGDFDFYIEAEMNNQKQKFEQQNPQNPGKVSLFHTQIIDAKAPLVLFDPETDSRLLSFTRIGDNIRRGIFKVVDGPDGNKAISMSLPTSFKLDHNDYTTSIVVKDLLLSRAPNLKDARYIEFQAKGNYAKTGVISLVEADGTTWVKRIELTDEWKTYRFEPREFGIGQGVKLPQGYPEQWNYWMPPALGRGGERDSLAIQNVERLMLSVRPEEGQSYQSDPQMEIGKVNILF